MAFKLENFGSEVANIKSILGGICFYTYRLPTGLDDVSVAGYFPTNLGIKQDDRIDVLPNHATPGATIRYVCDVDADTGVITCIAEGDI